MTKQKLKQLPSIDSWLKSPVGAQLASEFPRSEVAALMRTHVERLRQAVLGGLDRLPDFLSDEYASALRIELTERSVPSLKRTINATGIVIHTNLGRAPLARQAIEAVDAIAGGYSNVELDLETGKRGSRHTHIESLLTRLTGAEAALAVNNCAAAIMLTLRTLAADGEVIVSRGELVEIGGSFRMPDVIASSGAAMREVGTTNRTTLADYAREIGERTRVLLSSHPSNFRVVGFTSRPSLAELASLAHANDKYCVLDLGSGSLVDLSAIGLGSERDVAGCIADGVDVVTFSGDKLLGGPQAGIIAGNAELIGRIKRDPLARAMRMDKLSLAALSSTLRLYLPPNDPFTEIPILRMLTTDKASIASRARPMCESLTRVPGIEAHLNDDVGFAGGGTLPTVELPTTVVEITVDGMTASALAQHLRQAPRPVIARVKDDKLLIDLRTVAEDEEPAIVAALESASITDR